MGYITVGDENSRVSQDAVTGSWNVAVPIAPVAAYAVVPSWIEDFRADVEAVRDSGKPALVLHGTADDVLPIDAAARRSHQALPEARCVEIEGVPHGLVWTHTLEVDAAFAPSSPTPPTHPGGAGRTPASRDLRRRSLPGDPQPRGWSR